MNSIVWDDLTDAQKQVVESEDHLIVVRGAAGTGKTTVALWHAGHYLRQPDTLPWRRVLFLTFSRSAVSQLMSRARTAIKGVEDRVEVQTFHGFAYRSLLAFGRYAGQPKLATRIQSQAEVSLLGAKSHMLSYSDLVPKALDVLHSERISELVAARWPLVLCDEFQDTAPDQWSLIEHLQRRCRLILLADPNQMIYTFIPGVNESRLTDTEALADDIIELEPASHRDPSGIIPLLATAILRRDFDSEDVAYALEQGRLKVRCCSDDDDEVIAILREDFQAQWIQGARTFGIYVHSNEGVARLGAVLTGAEVDHVLVGIPEAQGEAFSAMSTLTAFALDEASEDDVRVALATFLTACTRGGRPPELALALVSNVGLPAGVEDGLASVLTALRAAGAEGIEDVSEVAQEAWDRMRITNGSAPWGRAAPVFASQVRLLARQRPSTTTEKIAALRAVTERMRAGALVMHTEAQPGTVQLMNFHQTKSREADCIALVYRSGDYLADRYEQEPFEKSSRVLYVAITRARKHVLVVLPPNPHPLVAPFANLVRS